MDLFILGLLFSVPLSIVANLLTPKVNNWIDSNNRQRAQRRKESLKAEFEGIKRYYEQPNELTNFALVTLIRLSIIGSSFSIASNVFFTLSNVAPSIIFVFIGQLFAISGSLLVLNTAQRALNTWARVRNFESYTEQVKRVIDITSK